MTARPTAFAGRLLIAGERPFDAGEVKAQAATTTTETHPAEFAGVRVHPIALDTEPIRHGRRVSQTRGPGFALALRQEFGDTYRDQLHVAGVEPTRAIARIG